MVLAALVVAGLFGAAGLIPHVRPSRAHIFSAVAVDFTLFANVIATAVFVSLFAYTRHGGRGGQLGCPAMGDAVS